MNLLLGRLCFFFGLGGLAAGIFHLATHTASQALYVVCFIDGFLIAFGGLTMIRMRKP